MKYPIFKPYGLHAILLEWEASIASKVHNEVVYFQQFIYRNFNKEIIELVPAYNSLLVYLKETVSPEDFILLLSNRDKSASETFKTERHLVSIPVCYTGTFGIDITEVATGAGLSIAEVIELHTAPRYPVYFIGFLPGFPYLGGLHKKLHSNRRAQPRTNVASGSVAIGGGQTGVYPSASPGGWNIIGRTPLELFSINSDGLCLLNAGDTVQFYEISEAKFHVISQQLKEGNYQVRKEVVDD